MKQWGERVRLLFIWCGALGLAVAVRFVFIPAGGPELVERASRRFAIDFGRPSEWFSAWTLGDGQAFAIIAADPSGALAGDLLYLPAYRFLRAGYGWATFLLAGGRTDAIPYALAGVGLIAVVAMIFLATKLRHTIGVRAWALLLNPALYLGFARDTAESLGLVLLVLASVGGSAVSALALGFTRPTYAVALFGKWKEFTWAGIGAVGILTLGIFQFGPVGLLAGGALNWPFLSFVKHPSAIGVLVLMGALVSIYLGVIERDLAWVAGGLFVLTFGDSVVMDPIHILRGAGYMPVLWVLGPGWSPMDRRALRDSRFSSEAKVSKHVPMVDS